MTERVESLLLGLGDAWLAALIGYGVARGEIGPGWIFLATLYAFMAIINAVRLGSAASTKSGEGR